MLTTKVIHKKEKWLFQYISCFEGWRHSYWNSFHRFVYNITWWWQGWETHIFLKIYSSSILLFRIPAHLRSSICTPLRVNQRLQLDRRTFNTEWWSRRRCFIQVFLFILFENIWYWIVFRGQILIAIKTEISDSIDTAPSEVEVEQTQTINEVTLWSYSDRYLNN